MRIRWRGLELPNRIELDADSATDTYGKFVIEPFERGYGVTIGNSLRRVLLSSLEGYAVTSVRIQHTLKDGKNETVTDVSHEFMGLPGVYEDVTEIVLNIKELLIRLHRPEPITLKLQKSGAGEVKAGDIETSSDFVVVNPDLKLCTITEENVSLSFEMKVNVGRGYTVAEENTEADMPFGTIPVDSIYSPVRRVRYKTENTRVGQKVDYDRLTMEIWTDGTKRPEEALVEASTLLRKHLNPFVKYFELGKEAEHEGQAIAMIAGGGDDELRELNEKLALPVSVLDPSVRASNCLQSANLRTLGDIVIRTEQEMMKIKNFGKGSLKEIKKKLADHGLSFGMELQDEILQAIRERAAAVNTPAES